MERIGQSDKKCDRFRLMTELGTGNGFVYGWDLGGRTIEAAHCRCDGALQYAGQSVDAQGCLGEEQLKGLIVQRLHRLTAC